MSEDPVLPQTVRDDAKWRNSTVPAWFPDHLAWRLFFPGLFVMAALALSTVLVWVLVSAQADEIEEASDRALVVATEKLDAERVRANQRQCVSIKRAVDRQRNSDIEALKYVDGLTLDLSTYELPPNTEAALTAAWDQVVMAEQVFLAERINSRPPIQCVRGVGQDLTVPDVGLDGRTVETP